MVDVRVEGGENGTNYKGSAMPDCKHKKDLPHVHKVRSLDELPAYTRGKRHADRAEFAIKAIAHLN